MNSTRESRHCTRLLGAIVWLIFLVAGCNSLEFRSHWRPQATGNTLANADWGNAMTPIEGKQAMVGFLNDSNYLYVSFVTDDRAIQRQVISRGFTLWIDQGGGKDKKFGIRFPLGMQMAGFPQPGREFAGEIPGGDTLRERIPLDTNELEIIGPKENERVRLKVIELKQIAVSLTISPGGLSYRLKVPLRNNGPDQYAIGTTAGASVGIGLETGSGSERRSTEARDRGGMSGGMGRGGRGRGGMRGGRAGGGGGGDESAARPSQQAEPLEVWAKVQLAGSESQPRQ